MQTIAKQLRLKSATMNENIETTKAALRRVADQLLSLIANEDSGNISGHPASVSTTTNPTTTTTTPSVNPITAAAAEHRRAFNYAARSTSSFHPSAQSRQCRQTKKGKQKVPQKCTMKFFCLGRVDDDKPPNTVAGKTSLSNCGLGPGKICVDINSNGIRQSLIEKFPLLSAADEKGFHKIAMPHTPSRIKEIAGQASIYIRPLQENIQQLQNPNVSHSQLAQPINVQTGPLIECLECHKEVPMDDFRMHQQEAHGKERKRKRVNTLDDFVISVYSLGQLPGSSITLLDAMDMNKCLNEYYEKKIKINQNERSDALEVWQSLVQDILNEVKRMDERFSLQMLYTGSFYERVKTESPDEFDLMLVLDKIQPEIKKSKVIVPGFTFMYISDAGNSQWKRDNIVDSEGRLNALQMRAVFARLVSNAIIMVQGKHAGKTIKAATHGPAVTLNINVGRLQYHVDLTLAIELSSWPATAKTWRHRPRKGWPSENFLTMIQKSECHVVAKQPNVCQGQDKPFLWRFSFSKAEKTIMNNMDSGISNSCRKRVLQILKAIVSNDPQLKSMPLTSYHIKTLIFWESENRPNGEDWVASNLQNRFLDAVDRMLSYMKKKKFPHYFLNEVSLVAEFQNYHLDIVSRKFEEIKNDPPKYIQSAAIQRDARRM